MGEKKIVTFWVQSGKSMKLFFEALKKEREADVESLPKSKRSRVRYVYMDIKRERRLGRNGYLLTYMRKFVDQQVEVVE